MNGGSDDRPCLWTTLDSFLLNNVASERQEVDALIDALGSARSAYGRTHSSIGRALSVMALVMNKVKHEALFLTAEALLMMLVWRHMLEEAICMIEGNRALSLTQIEKLDELSGCLADVTNVE